MFIVFEGLDGSGKTTQVKLLFEWLSKHRYNAVSIKSPGTTQLGESVRAIMLTNKTLTEKSKALLYTACHVQLNYEFITPSLIKNKVVLCDRYVHSTMAYQKNYNWILRIGNIRQPDLIFYFDIPPQLALERKNKSNDFDDLDSFDLAFYKNVASNYEAMIQQDKWVRIDATQSIEAIHKQIVSVFVDRIEAL